MKQNLIVTSLAVFLLLAFQVALSKHRANLVVWNQARDSTLNVEKAGSLVLFTPEVEFEFSLWDAIGLASKSVKTPEFAEYLYSQKGNIIGNWEVPVFFKTELESITRILIANQQFKLRNTQTGEYIQSYQTLPATGGYVTAIALDDGTIIYREQAFYSLACFLPYAAPVPQIEIELLENKPSPNIVPVTIELADPSLEITPDLSVELYKVLEDTESRRF